MIMCVCMGFGEILALLVAAVAMLAIPVLHVLGFVLSKVNKSWGAPFTQLAHNEWARMKRLSLKAWLVLKKRVSPAKTGCTG